MKAKHTIITLNSKESIQETEWERKSEVYLMSNQQKGKSTQSQILDKISRTGHSSRKEYQSYIDVITANHTPNKQI